MPIFNKPIIGHEPQLTRRLFTGCFSQMGHVRRNLDTRTTAQLLENIDYFAKRFPEVEQFKAELKSINPKYLGLVSDICELANHTELINTSIDIKKRSASNGKSLFQYLMEKLPQASKENPASLELFQAIIDNTDSIASKYALGYLYPIYDSKQRSDHITAIIPLIGDIAEATLNGGDLMDFSKERSFADAIKKLTSPYVQLEKLQILSKITKFAENANARCLINAFPFVTNKTPMANITENLETFKNLDKNMTGKEINLTEFLEKNVNLV